MEIEIELNVALTPSLTEKVRGRLNKKVEIVAFKAADNFSLRSTGGGGSSDYTIDQEIQNYLGSVESVGPLLAQASGVVRVGVFFSEGEAAAFSVLLSNTTVQMLARYQFTIDVTCYPCS